MEVFLKPDLIRASLAVATILLSTPPSQAMDCTKAASLVESAVCADPQLTWQDDAISRNYFAALKVLRAKGDKASHDRMQKEQRRWLARRQDCELLAAGGLGACVEAETRQRLSTLPTQRDATDDLPPAGMKLARETLTWGRSEDGMRTLNHHGRVVLKERYAPRNDPPFMVLDRWRSGDMDAALIQEAGIASGDCATFSVVESRTPGAVARHELGEACVGDENSSAARNAEGFAFSSPASPLADGHVRQWQADTGRVTESKRAFNPEPSSTMKSLASSQKPETIEPLRNAEFFAAVSRLSPSNKQRATEALWDLTNGCETCNLEHPELYGVALDPKTIAYSGCSWFWNGGHFLCGLTDALAVWDREGGGFYFATDKHSEDGHHGAKAEVEPPLASWPAPARARYERWRKGEGWTAETAH
jgi:uncharacterized protein